MTETDEIDGANFVTRKAAINLVCEAVKLYASAAGESEESADVFLFELAKAVEMSPDGRAAKFLEHFIFGHGQPIKFECADLVEEDAGIRRRITSEISRRLTANAELTHRHLSGGEFCVSIRQKDFEVPDWCLALGSYAIEWRVVNSPALGGSMCASSRGNDWIDPGTNALTRHRGPDTLADFYAVKPKKVRIYGANEYRWHPAANRVTQCIHQAGDRLTRSRLHSMNFWMIAKPCTIDLDTGLTSS